jgi:hypothetical protein
VLTHKKMVCKRNNLCNLAIWISTLIPNGI